MRALIIQPDAFDTPAMVGEALEDRGVELDTFVIQPDMEQPEGRTDFPPLEDYDLVVVMGSPWSVYDEAVSGWVEPLLETLRTAVSANQPVLGVCFGGQALSAALGGLVERSEETEFGWRDVDSDVPALDGPWFEYHHDVFSIPAGAVELARNEVGSQAFRVGRALAVQFHPELDAGHLTVWFETGDEARLQDSGIDTVAVMKETREREADARRRVRELVDWFLDGVAGLG